jgi:hypothetical protein
MENTSAPNQFVNDLAPLPEKPQFLKVLCILSFIACGLMILLSAIGTLALGIDEATITGLWDQVLQKQPQLESVDPVEFFHAVGMVCVYTLIANIVSLVGVIMMWRLNKIGFFIYVAAELVTHFFSIDVSGEGSSYGGLIFGVFLDLVFITLYAVNLKHMKKKEVL